MTVLRRWGRTGGTETAPTRLQVQHSSGGAGHQSAVNAHTEQWGIRKHLSVSLVPLPATDFNPNICPAITTYKKKQTPTSMRDTVPASKEAGPDKKLICQGTLGCSQRVRWLTPRAPSPHLVAGS